MYHKHIIGDVLRQLYDLLVKLNKIADIKLREALNE